MKRDKTTWYVFVTLIVVDLAMVLGYLVQRKLDWNTWYVRRFMDLNGEDSLSAWYASAKLSWVGLLLACCGVAVARSKQRKGAWPLIALGVLFVAMSADEAVQAHEHVGWVSDALLPGGDRDNTWFGDTGIWMALLGLPTMVLMAWMLKRARGAWASVPAVTSRFVLGLVIFFSGALLIETLANIEMSGMWLWLQVSAEEGCEMVGVSLILWAVMDLTAYRVFGKTLYPGGLFDRGSATDAAPSEPALASAA